MAASNFISTKIYADTYALVVCVFGRTKAIPKAHRPTLGRTMEEAALQLLFAVKAAGLAAHAPLRHSLCNKGSDWLDKFRICAQLAKDLGFFSETAYFEISEKSAEVGRQLGGWKKSLEATRKTHGEENQTHGKL